MLIGTVLVRTTLGAVFVVGAALLAGSLALVGLLGDALTRDITTAAQTRAQEVAASLDPGDAGRVLGVVEDDEQLIQVLGASGDVVASSANIAGRAPVARVRAGETV